MKIFPFLKTKRGGWGGGMSKMPQILELHIHNLKYS